MYGYKGEGIKAGNPIYEIYKFYPSLPANYGLLSGPAFSISYAISGILMGLLIKKYNRKMLISLATIIWSLTSIISGTTNSFAVLFLMRFLLGCFVSATEPVGFSLVGDYFPKNMRTTANSIIGTATYIGSASAALILFLTRSFGWRKAYLCTGGFGLIIGILGLIFIKDPKKGLQD